MNTEIVDALIDAFFILIKVGFYIIVIGLVFVCALLAASSGPWCF